MNMDSNLETDIDRFMERQAQHKPHDSCLGAGDPDYHTEEEYRDPPEQEEADVA